VALSEFAFTELYLLLRNPAVLAYPLKALEAVEVIQRHRQIDGPLPSSVHAPSI
jgi:hypothetical protein